MRELRLNDVEMEILYKLAANLGDWVTPQELQEEVASFSTASSFSSARRRLERLGFVETRKDDYRLTHRGKVLMEELS